MSDERNPSTATPPLDDAKVAHLEKRQQAGLHDAVTGFEGMSPEQHSKTFRKDDLRLMPLLMALYLIANLDRANLGNDKIEGPEADLKMTGNNYNIANVMFFIPAFSGLLAAAIAKMSGIACYNGWRWVFITEGILTVVLDEIQYLNFLYQKHRGGHAQQNEPQREGVPAEKTNKWKVLGSVLTD
ncbi:unnamed protein product [Clonostachys chloroleuca]|uniref:High-affinity nicotinic acid transporter n=1 Tax=Clonostachys chloroleuca TaxID=1926264 RepID=A0AA35LNP5_9HYPO|nr:unnamed protein product [Clonostachys chloroleuca]